MMFAIGLATVVVSPALAGPPVTDGPSGEPDNDTFMGARSPAQANFEAAKLQLVAAIEALPSDAGQALNVPATVDGRVVETFGHVFQYGGCSAGTTTDTTDSGGTDVGPGTAS